MNINGVPKFLLVLLLACFNNSFAQKIPFDSLNVKLEKILIEDQSIRVELDTLYANNADTAQINKTHTLMKILNKEHLKFISYVLDTYSWPPKDSLSKKANIALFLVVQHSEASFKKKYFPIIKKGLKKGDIDIEDYAYLIDRYNIQCNGYQIYGTQTTAGEWGGNFFIPIANEKKVNNRRRKLGMEPIDSIASIFKMDYELPDKNNNKRLYCVYGFVENDGKPLNKVNVRSFKSSTETNNNGFFKLYIKKKDILKPILFKKEGFKDEEITVATIQNKLHRYFITMN